MSSRPELHLAWCSHKAARYAVEHWHYSRTMPIGKLVKIGVWEDERFVGAIIFGRGANRNIGRPYGLKQTEICELVRIALTKHATPVSRITTIAIRMLCETAIGLQLIISYADPKQGHVGTIYQAMGWLFVGSSQPQCAVLFSGRIMHKRTAHQKWGTIVGLQQSCVTWKYKYIYPLNSIMRERASRLQKPYPKHEGQKVQA